MFKNLDELPKFFRYQLTFSERGRILTLVQNLNCAVFVRNSTR